MNPIISIVGKSNSGKTTLLESLIAELKRRGYKVAVVKHSAEDVELDAVSKDTWRFSQAGSEISAIVSADKLAVFKHVEADFSPQALSYFTPWDYDIILTEGFKRSSYPKIEVHRKEQGVDLVSPPEQLLAVVTDDPLPIDKPQFSKDEFSNIVDLIEKTILSQKAQDDVDMIINGAPVPMSPSTKNLLLRTLVAVVSGLKGLDRINHLHISLRRKA